MQSLFKPTRTKVHSPSAQRRERERGLLSASRTAAAIQLGTQLLLWIFFFGYDQTEQTVWQAMLMLFVPLTALWLVWKKTLDHPSACWWKLPLVGCLLLDAVFLLSAVSGLIGQLVPAYPAWVPVVIPAAICYLTALRARARGVKYGAAVLAVPLIGLLILGTVFLRASTRADRMWPILGNGLLATARSALTGTGAVWGAALLYLHPSGRRTAGWTFVPWGLCVLCAVWFGFLNPWSAGDTLAVAEKMMGLARHAHSVILYEMTGILWMILLPTSLTACFSASGQLIGGAFPSLPEWISLAFLPLLAVSGSLFLSGQMFSLLNLLLPWRFVLSLFCGAGLLVCSRRRT